MKSQETSTQTPGHNGGAHDAPTAGVHQNTDSMSSFGKPTVDRMTAGAHDAVDRFSSVANHAVETLGAKGDQINAAEQRMLASTRKYVEENPVTSLAIAIATGYALSRIFSSR